MKKAALLIYLALLPLFLHAKKEGRLFIDSVRDQLDGQALVNVLEKKIAVSKEDTNKVMILDAICFFYSNINPDTGIKYGLVALDLSTRLGYKGYLSNIYGNIGANYMQKSDFPKGLEYLFLCLKMEEEHDERGRTRTTLYNISSGYFNMGEYDKALEYANRSLKICEKMHDTASVGANLSNIGAIYTVKGDAPRAFDYLFRALKIVEQANDKPMVAITLGHISAVYHDQKKYKEALEYGQKALKLSEELGDRESMCVILGDIGNFYLGMATDSVNGVWTVRNYACLDKAIDYYKQSVALCKETRQLEVLTSSDRSLSEAYELKGDYKEAIKCYREYVTVRDSAHSDDSKLKLARLETQREAELKEKQIEINKLAANKRKNEYALFAVGIISLLAIIAVVVRNFMVQKKANKAQEDMLKQKDVFMKEIHHRVKNNLQVISSLLDLQLSNITDEHARNAMTESNTRIRSISLIHQQLYQNENITTIEFSKFAKDLMYQVASVFNATGQQIMLRSNMPETLLDIDTAVPLGLILNELMTNSYKYAFAAATDGYIEITLRHDHDYELTYKDSGPGLPESVSMKGVGMKVIRSLCKQIGGAFLYMDKEKSFLVTFKDMAGRKMID